MTIGEKLTALRQRKGLTQVEFCKDFSRRYPELKINRTQYSHWEIDNRTMQLKHFKALVTYYRITADDLLFDDWIPPVLMKTKRKRAESLLH